MSNIPINISSQMVNVYGIALPKYHNFDDSQFNESFADTYCLTESVKKSLFNIAKNFNHSNGILISGPPCSGKSSIITEFSKMIGFPQNLIIRLQLSDQTESKSLIGSYVTSDRPGQFEYAEGLLTKALRLGAWLVIEDYHALSNDIKGIFKPILNGLPINHSVNNSKISPSLGFKLFATSLEIPGYIEKFDKNSIDYLWEKIIFNSYTVSDLLYIINKIINSDIISSKLCSIYQLFNSYDSSSKKSRTATIRDLIKLCIRIRDRIKLNKTLDFIYFEVIDIFLSDQFLDHYPPLIFSEISQILTIDIDLIQHYNTFVTQISKNENLISIGRTQLSISKNFLFKEARIFADTAHSLRYLEKIASAVYFNEPILLVGETGTGKTTMVQHLANLTNNKLIVINMSQQSDSTDLLGGLKPTDSKKSALKLMNNFTQLFQKHFPSEKNKVYLDVVFSAFKNSNWNKFIKCLKNAVMKAFQLYKIDSISSIEPPFKNQKISHLSPTKAFYEWTNFSHEVNLFELDVSKIKFEFNTGLLPLAIENGSWILLDEINLALPETLLCISGLLESQLSSLILLDRNDIQPIKRHKDFRIFACMNPSTDITKKDLSPSLRSRFTEFLVPSLESSIQDLTIFISTYLSHSTSDEDLLNETINDVIAFFLEARRLQSEKSISDGANVTPHYSIRSLSRALMYTNLFASSYGVTRSLYDGLTLTFETQLNVQSRKLINDLLKKHILKDKIPIKVLIKSSNKPPNILPKNYDTYTINSFEWLKLDPFWLIKGNETPDESFINSYVITNSVRENLINLSRAVMMGDYPILIQGPTSSGKTSLVQYLSNITGHKFIRINNHEQTDIQEYLGQYISDSTGSIRFQEGALVTALRKGHWLVLDELNLAPSDVLESLNRLLDDNREILLTETGDIVKPHPHFRLFATQNPAGLQYGGRKLLSRAFRNRFVELAFDDLPQDELENILSRSKLIPISYSKKIVAIYKDIKKKAVMANIFDRNSSPITLRDLFRWANRAPDSYQRLAEYGYMLLCERCRIITEKQAILEVIEKHLKIKLNPVEMYSHERLTEVVRSINAEVDISKSPVTWTFMMRRLFILLCLSFKNKEPMLFVGETGCGKTTVCQVYSSVFNIFLTILNCHLNTETSDFIGSQRPIRSSKQKSLIEEFLIFLSSLGLGTFHNNSECFNFIDYSEFSNWLNRIKQFNSIQLNKEQNEQYLIFTKLIEQSFESKNIFEWVDGPLLKTFINGGVFLLDEISLASDAVLERLNSVLETPNRTLLIAEKGSNETMKSHENFNIVATMNPPGDHGKRELSYAFRNRFVEIFVDDIHFESDLIQIINDKLYNLPLDLKSQFSLLIIDFIKRINNCDQINNTIKSSLRDIVSFSNFINHSFLQFSDEKIYLLGHGACIIYLDSMNKNIRSSLSIHENRLAHLRHLLSNTVSDEILENKYYRFPLTESLEKKQWFCQQIIDNTHEFGIGDFKILKGDFQTIKYNSFLFTSPTTYDNIRRILRALQIEKPILLEGSPGCGKTAIIEELANKCNIELIRVNLSDQTDIVDLLGTDMPSSNKIDNKIFEFYNGPLLDAMVTGKWILMDEMNLASQTVLEGLNSILDHRQSIFISELGKTFIKHKNFRFFAAQNPHLQGGGRKPLPKSFLNRFTNVFFDDLLESDLLLICSHRFPELPESLIKKILDFNKKVYIECRKSFNWEPNLRDLMKFFAIVSGLESYNFIDLYPALNIVYLSRIYLENIKKLVISLFNGIFGFAESQAVDFLGYSITISEIQIGYGKIKRKPQLTSQTINEKLPMILNYQLPYLQSIIVCIENNWMPILISQIGSGKGIMIKWLSVLTNNELVEFDMNSTVDINDILGNLEITNQIPSNIFNNIKQKFLNIIESSIIAFQSSISILPKILSIKYKLIKSCSIESLLKLYNQLNLIVSSFNSNLNSDDNYKSYFELISSFQNIFKLKIEEYNFILEKNIKSENIKFSWIDGPVINAMKKGQWLHIKNADTGPNAVLDRLNSLVEQNGNIRIYEGYNDSSNIITPHPNFRLILSVNISASSSILNLNEIKLSRAMRNRGVEIVIPSPKFDDSKNISRLSQYLNNQTINFSDILKISNFTGYYDECYLQSVYTNTFFSDSIISNTICSISNMAASIKSHKYNERVKNNEIYSLESSMIDFLPQSFLWTTNPFLAQFFIDFAPFFHSILNKTNLTNNLLKILLLSSSSESLEFFLYLLENGYKFAGTNVASGLFQSTIESFNKHTLMKSTLSELTRCTQLPNDSLSLDMNFNTLLFKDAKQKSEQFDDFSLTNYQLNVNKCHLLLSFIIFNFMYDSYIPTSNDPVSLYSLASLYKTDINKFDYLVNKVFNFINSNNKRKLCFDLNTYLIRLHEVINLIFSFEVPYDHLSSIVYYWYLFNIQYRNVINITKTTIIINTIHILISPLDQSEPKISELTILSKKLLSALNCEQNNHFEEIWRILLSPLQLKPAYIHDLFLNYLIKLDSYRFKKDRMKQTISYLPIEYLSSDILKVGEVITKSLCSLYQLSGSVDTLFDSNIKELVLLLDDCINIIDKKWVKDEPIKPSHYIYSFLNYLNFFKILKQTINFASRYNDESLNNNIESLKPSIFLSWNLNINNSLLFSVQPKHHSLYLLSTNELFNSFFTHFQEENFVFGSFITNNLLQCHKQKIQSGLSDLTKFKNGLNYLFNEDFSNSYDVSLDWGFPWTCVYPFIQCMLPSSYHYIFIKIQKNCLDYKLLLDLFKELSLYFDTHSTLSLKVTTINQILSLFCLLFKSLSSGIDMAIQKLYISGIWLTLSKYLLLFFSSNCHYDPVYKYKVELELNQYKSNETHQELEAYNVMATNSIRLNYTVKNQELKNNLKMIEKSNQSINENFRLRPDNEESINDFYKELSVLEPIFDLKFIDQVILFIQSNNENNHIFTNSKSKFNSMLDYRSLFHEIKLKFSLLNDLLIPIEFGFNVLSFGLCSFNECEPKIYPSALNSIMVEDLYTFLLSYPVSINITIQQFFNSDIMNQLQTIYLQKPYKLEQLKTYSKLLKYLVSRFVIEKKIGLNQLCTTEFHLFNKILCLCSEFYTTIKEFNKQLELEKSSLYKMNHAFNLNPESEEELNQQLVNNLFLNYDQEFEVYNDSTIKHQDLDHYLKAQKEQEAKVLSSQFTWFYKSNWSSTICTAINALFSKADLNNSIADRFYFESFDLACYLNDNIPLYGSISLNDKLYFGNKIILDLLANQNYSTALIWVDEPLNIYKHSFIKESLELLPILNQMLKRIMELHQEFEEHEVINQLIHLINLLLNLPVYDTPLMRYLAGIEILLTKAQNWELYAPKALSLSQSLDLLTKLLVKWRRLELENWANLLKQLEVKMQLLAFEHWISLYDALVNNDIYDTNSFKSAFSLLFEFISLSTYGEFQSRLLMIQNINQCLKMKLEPNLFLTRLIESIDNLIKYYGLFTPHFKQFLISIKKPIEKELKDLLKLASWKDCNLESLKHSANKTHYRLAKLIRKFEKELMTSMAGYFIKISVDDTFVPSLIPSLCLTSNILPIFSQLDLQSLTFGNQTIENLSIDSLYKTINEHFDTYINKECYTIRVKFQFELIHEFITENVQVLNGFQKVNWSSEWNTLLKEFGFELIGLSMSNPTPPKQFLEVRDLDFETEQRRFMSKWNGLIKKNKMIRQNQMLFFLNQLKFSGVKSLRMEFLTESFPEQTNWLQNTNNIPQLLNDHFDLNSLIVRLDSVFYLSMNRFLYLSTLVTQPNPVNSPDLAHELKSRSAMFSSRINFWQFNIKNYLVKTISNHNKIELLLSTLINHNKVEERSLIISGLPRSERYRYFYSNIIRLHSIVSQLVNYFSKSNEDKDILIGLQSLKDVINHQLEINRREFSILTNKNYSSLLIQETFSAVLNNTFVNINNEWNQISPYFKTKYNIVFNQIDCLVNDFSMDLETDYQSIDELNDAIKISIKSILLATQHIIEAKDKFSMLNRQVECLSQNQLVEAFEYLQLCYLAIEKSKLEYYLAELVKSFQTFDKDYFIDLLGCLVPFLKAIQNWILNLIVELAKSLELIGQLNLRFIEVLICIYKNGLALPTPFKDVLDDECEETEQGGQNNNGGGEGAGIGEGKGEKNVNDEIENLEQILDNPLDKAEQEDSESVDGKDNDQQDLDNPEGFNAPLESEDDFDSQDEGEKQENDEEIGGVGQDALDDKLWNSEKNEPKKDLDKNVDSSELPNNDVIDDLAANNDESNNLNNDTDNDNNQVNSEQNGENNEEEDISKQVPEDHVPDKEKLELPDELDMDLSEEDAEMDVELNKDEMSIDEEENEQEQRNVDQNSDIEKDENLENGEMEVENEQDEIDTELSENIDDEMINQKDDEMVDVNDEEKESNPINTPSKNFTTEFQNDNGQSNDAGQSNLTQNQLQNNNEPSNENKEISQNVNDDAKGGDNSHGSSKDRSLADCIEEWRSEIKAINSDYEKTNNKPLPGNDNNEAQDNKIRNEKEEIKENTGGDLILEDQEKSNALQFCNDDNQDEVAWGDADVDQKNQIDNLDEKKTDDKSKIEPQSIEDVNIEETLLLKQDSNLSNNVIVKEKRFPSFDNWFELIKYNIDSNIDQEKEYGKKIWEELSYNNQQFSEELSQQLVIILQTQSGSTENVPASKLRGFYKRGKRIYIKKLIQYIASNYKQDLFWLKRMPPPIRKLKLMIAVDDSLSMRADPSIIYFTINAINLIINSVLNKPELNNNLNIEVCGFGDKIKPVLDDHKDFDDIYRRVLNLKFDQATTDWTLLLSYILDKFSANSDSNENRKKFIDFQIMNLCLVISDGLCQDHSRILKLSRLAEEQNIIIVAIIIDQNNYLKGKQSILDLERVIIQDGNLRMENYLEGFPVKFLVCNDISGLASLISMVLSQCSSFF